MNTDRTLHRARVIIGATCFADAEASLQVAVMLAKQTGSKIHGVLVTDDAILASVSTPHTRTIAYSGRALQDVTEQTMHAAFRADARRFERKLIDAARAASLEAAFSEARGLLAGVLRQSAGAGDLVVFGFRRAIDVGGRVVLACGSARPDRDVLELGARLSAGLGKPLTVFAAPEFESDIIAILSGLSVRRFETRACTDIGALLAHLERMSPSAVVVGYDSPDLSSMMRLVDAARCPVVVPIPNAAQSTQQTDQNTA